MSRAGPRTVTGTGHRPWSAAMADALTGPAGFYRRPDAVAANFRTAASAAQFAIAVAVLLENVDRALDRPDPVDFVDVGAADGRLIQQVLDALAPPTRRRVRATAVELHRPRHLGRCDRWARRAPGGVSGLVFANEWLDTVPVQLVDRRGPPHAVEVAAGGDRRRGRPADRADSDWLARYWPAADRTAAGESGLRRDRAWAQLTGSLRRGLAVAVDYRLHPGNAALGTVTGYARGRQVPPRFDGTVDVTAAVNFASLAAAGARPDGETQLLSQPNALSRLWLHRPLPERDPLARLRAVGERAELRDRTSFGGFWWLLQSAGIPAGSAFASDFGSGADG